MGSRRPRASGATEGPKRTDRGAGRVPARREAAPRRAAAAPAGELVRLHARRLRACRSLGLAVPRGAASGTPETLLRRIAQLDRRIEVSLDLAGGMRFPAWVDEEEDGTDPGADEPSGGSS